MQPMTHDDIETHLLVEAVRLKYGYDFRGYAAASLKRRLHTFAQTMSVPKIGDLIPMVLNDAKLLPTLINSISVPVSEMFRDPEIHLYLRQEVFPILASFPQINIWIAGCATGEEAYSIAIALHEENLLKRSRIYATDINAAVLKEAEEGVFRIDDIRAAEENYHSAGGAKYLSNYMTVRYGFAKIDAKIRENLLFSTHNLVSDGVFGEFSLILCRNVMIYFKKELKERTIELMCESLGRTGFICLGPKDAPPKNVADRLLTKITQGTPVFKRKQGVGTL